MPRSRSRLLPSSLLLASLISIPAAHAAEHHLGIGLHYWEATDDFPDVNFDVNSDGTSLVGSWRIVPRGLVSFEIDLEYFDDGFGGSNEEAYSPTVFLLVGKALYGGVGAGVTLSDGLEGDVSDPFYAARIGLDLLLLPRVHLDINANYRANAFNDLDQVDSDAVTLGASLRFRIR